MTAAASIVQNGGPVAASERSNLRGFSRLGSLWTLYTLTLRQNLHGRRWMVMVALFLLPAAIAALVRTTAGSAPARDMEFVLAFMFVPQALVPIVALLYASGMIQDEQEDQTITYLLVRPIPKWALYLTKLAATWTTAIVLVILLTAVTYAAIYVHREVAVGEVLSRTARAATVHSLAVVAYCALFGLVSLVTKRMLIAGIVYIALIEGICANLPFGIRLITVIYYARLIAYRTLDFVVASPGGPENIAADAWQLDIVRDPKLLDHPSMQTCLLVLILGSVVCAAIAAWLCQGREFRVKTPESE